MSNGTPASASHYPAATVKDGPQTYQEMMNGFMFYVDANEKLGLDNDPKTGRARK